MNLETQAAMYFHLTNYTKWNILGALQFLSETIDFTSENTNDIAETFRRQLETLSNDSNVLSTAKNKATKMYVNLEETLTRRLDIKEFFESQDLKYAQVFSCANAAWLVSHRNFLIVDIAGNFIEKLQE